MPSRKQRILFTIGSMGGGGAERQTINYLRYLDRDRYEPALYLHYRQGEFLNQIPLDVPVVAFWDRHVPPRRHLRVPGRIFAMQVQDLTRVLIEQRSDAVCAVTSLAVLATSRAVRRRRLPWLAVEMADPRLDFGHQVKRFRLLKRWILTRAYRQADAAIAVSAGCREGMRQFYRLGTKPIALVRNFVDVAEIDRLAGQPNPCPELPGFRIVTVGRLDEQKGHVYLLEAVARLVHDGGRRNVRLDILGQGPLEDELKSLVRSRNLENHVRFLGFQTNPFAVIARCHLFCLPSIYEGLPLALLEGMACRVPVLTTDCPSGPHEVLEGGRLGGLVRPANAAVLAEAIGDAMDRYADWTARVAAARLRIEREFSIAAVMPRFESVLNETLCGTSRPRG